MHVSIHVCMDVRKYLCVCTYANLIANPHCQAHAQLSLIPAVVPPSTRTPASQTPHPPFPAGYVPRPAPASAPGRRQAVPGVSAASAPPPPPPGTGIITATPRQHHFTFIFVISFQKASCTTCKKGGSSHSLS